MAGLYLISGTEDFSVKERASELILSLCGDPPEDNPALEIIRGDNDNEKFSIVLDRFMEALETPPFLSPEKIIWLKHFNKFEDAFGESSTKKKPSRMDRLGEFLSGGLPPDLTVIIDGTGLDRRKAFFKLCEKLCASSGGKLEWFEKVDMKSKGAAQILDRKIREAAMNCSKRIDEGAASFLAETIGGDAARLKNEMEKLASYVGEKNQTITLADCLEVCSRSTETLAWNFSSELAAKNGSRAISLIPGIIETLELERGSSSRPEMAILAAASAEFQRLLSARCAAERFAIPRNANSGYFYSLFESQKNADGPKNAFFSLHPFRAFKIWENAMRFSEDEFANAFSALFEASKQMVSGGDTRLALENLVMKITGVRR